MQHDSNATTDAAQTDNSNTIIGDGCSMNALHVATAMPLKATDAVLMAQEAMTATQSAVTNTIQISQCNDCNAISDDKWSTDCTQLDDDNMVS